jgi:Dolichyl-phosphate-mannose-protein mannosyltransferase
LSLLLFSDITLFINRNKMKRIKLIWLIIFLIGVGARSTELFHAVDTESWRESDMATIAKNFYQNKTDIFHPQIAWDGSGPGYTESEFQIYTYMIATSYKIFGFWEPTGRIISFIFSLATLLVFFKLSRFLLNEKAALVASLFFAISPILLVIANSIQPESIMFFFYVCSGYTFLRWLDNQSAKYYLLLILSTALALLCKITAANIGLMFVIMIVVKKDWKFLFNPKVLLLGVCSVVPSAIWYVYGNRFFVLYGNSLGLSNEYAWVGFDIFTNKHFIPGIIKNEIFNVWTLAGPVIMGLAIAFTKWIKKETTLVGISWLASAVAFYILAMRTTADDWGYYYHIFSIPAVALLLGSAVIELWDKYFPAISSKATTTINSITAKQGKMIIGSLAVLVCLFVFSSFKYFYRIKADVFQTSPFYQCKDSLVKLIPEGSLVLANGGLKGDKLGHPKAFNDSYFFYWINRKGYNITIEDQSIKNVLLFKAKGAAYFIAEERTVGNVPGFVNELKQNFKLIFECNGCMLFQL